MQQPPDLMRSLGNTSIDRHGEIHADCPFCGKTRKKGQTHFSLFIYKKEWAFKCHVCGEGGGMMKLAQQLGTEQPARMPVLHVAPRKPPKWQNDTDYYLERFTGALMSSEAWQAYKPLTLSSIARWRLGVGVLPASRCTHPRLIVPVFDGGRVVAFHGRAYVPADTDAKWLTSGGSRKDVLFNAEYLSAGKTVIICENLVDSIMAMQGRDDVVAVASGGVGWRGENLEHWCDLIAASEPRRVIVWLDNDLSGQASGAVYQRLLHAWRAEMRQRVKAGTIPRIPTPPEPAGPHIANALIKRRIPVHLYRWTETAPIKADVGWALQGGLS